MSICSKLVQMLQVYWDINNGTCAGFVLFNWNISLLHYTIQTTYFQQAHSFLCVFVLKLYGYYSPLRAWGHMLIYSITNSLIIKGAISAQPLAPNVLSYQGIKALRSSCY